MPYIPLTLFLPIFLMIGRMRVSTVMPVPKATVYKHSYFPLRKHKIGMSLYLVISSPTGNPVSLEYFN